MHIEVKLLVLGAFPELEHAGAESADQRILYESLRLPQGSLASAHGTTSAI